MITVFEDNKALNLEPICLTRAVFDIRFGSETIFQRINRLSNNKVSSFYVRDSIRGITQNRYPIAEFDYNSSSNNVWLNASVVWNSNDIEKIMYSEESIFISDNELIGFNLSKNLSYGIDLVKEFSMLNIPKDISVSELSVKKINYLWDMISLIKDIVIETQERFKPNKIPENIVIDEANGPVVIADNVSIGPFTFLKGPVFLDAESKISSHSIIQNSIIGPGCKVGGEISGTIFQGWSNKAHDGHLGDSIIGEWVNFGAGSTNSNLKNNYKSVSVTVNGSLVNTNSLFIGLFIGDHSKVAIGTQFNAGTNVGVGCSVIANAFPERYIPSFTFYNNDQIKKINFVKFLETAKVVKERRNQNLSEFEINLLKKIYNK